MSELGKLALKYASQGFHVFPLTPNSKIPMKGSRGLHDATTDEAQIRSWWEKTPDANIGIRTGKESGITVLDFDQKSGGMAARDNWFDLVSFEVATPGGGRHLYLQYDPDLLQTAGLAPGVDVRNDGGYVVGPGSLVDGKPYLVEFDSEFSVVPDYVKEKQKERATTEARSAEGGAGAGVLEGGRNVYLTRVAGALRRQAIAPENLKEILLAVNETQCDPPLPEKEVGIIAGSIARKQDLAPDEPPASTVIEARDLIGEMQAYLGDKEKVKGEPTGFDGLDSLLGGGLRLGELVALHAEAKTGKNTVMHRMILKLLERCIPVGYASRELSPAEEVLPNLLSISIGKNALTTELSPELITTLVDPWKLYFAYGYGEFPLEELERWVVDLIDLHGVRYFFLDHLHYMLMNEDYQQAARLIKKLKTLAKKHKVHMFIIIQPTKVLDGQELGLNTLKGGSAIGQTIDTLLTLTRDKDHKNITRLTLTHARSRLAKTGEIALKYDEETMDLQEMEYLPPPIGGGFNSERMQVE